MKTFWKLFFAAGAIISATSVAQFPDYSEQQMFAAFVFAMYVLGFLLSFTIKGQRRIDL